jgi:16S rRNA (guanine527-N7)-methyltransferase
MRPLEQELRSGLAEFGLSLSDGQIGVLLEYLNLIHKWTKTYNLTSVRNPADMLTHHLLDSLAVIAPLRLRLADLSAGVSAADKGAANLAPTRVRLLDVGSGAGLPGVVIAICCPDIWVDCVDAVAKKVAFIRHVAGALKLPNLNGLHQRVEDLSGTYRVVSSRAFSSLSDFVRLSNKLLAPDGIWLAMKGKFPEDEISVLPGNAAVFHVEQLTVPGLGANRCIVWMRKT